MILARPITRRIVAAIILAASAVGSVLLWNRGQIDWVDLGANLIAATLGMAFLHYRWRAQEARAMTPGKVKDIFS